MAVATPAQADEYRRKWAGLDETFTERVRDAAETLVFFDGEFVSFVHLGSDGAVSNYTCISN